MTPSQLTVVQLAEALGVTEGHLWSLVRDPDQMFKPSRTIIRNGKKREIDPPKPGSKPKLRSLHRFLQRAFKPHPAVHGGVRGRSCFTSARKHLGRSFLVTRDLKNAYPSISTEMLQRKLKKRGFRSDVAWVLSRLFTLHSRVPQGSPLSGDALNFFMYETDRAISAVCGHIGAHHSRNSDDTVVSVNSRSLVEIPGRIIEEQVLKEGLLVNQKKRREMGLQPEGKEKRVHNLVVNSPLGVRICQKQAQKAADLALSFVRGAKAVSPDSLQAMAIKRRSLHGWLNHFRQAEFSPVKHVGKLVEAGDRHISRKLARLGLVFHRKKWWLLIGARDEANRLARLWKLRLQREQQSQTRT